MTVWTETWPEGDGDWYWFYGSPYGAKGKALMSVRVWKIWNGFCWVADGHFIYPENAEGVWVPMTLPGLPEKGKSDD
ncbi:hypothetical protein LCGC14_1929170 [marine sediment metagenome]|uniref:DUF551 domain-containing protein n=1 Tax=marine sediment metagenome TaxID=412755 RepID=A0A0F9GBY8_9ZZZZ